MRQGLPLALLLLVAALIGFAVRPARPASSATGPTIQQAVIEAVGRQQWVAVIVTLRQPPAPSGRRFDVAALRAQVAGAQAALLEDLPPNDFQLGRRYQAVAALAGKLNKEGLAVLSGRPDVADVMLDGAGHAGTAQSVPLIHADEVHRAGWTGAGVTVAVLDTGIDTDHPDLSNDIAYERCYLTNAMCPAAPHVAEDNNGHGTNVAGIITDTGTLVPEGVAPDAKIAVYKVLNSGGSGVISDWIAALDDIAADHPEVKVINMSLQSGLPCPASALDMAITTLWQRGTATFVSAGNQGTKQTLTVPACLANGISVGATYDASIGLVNGWKTDCSDPTTGADMVACWSSSSVDLDVLAPGAPITSAGIGPSRTSTYYGTSQASPHAAGVAALLFQARPGLSVEEMLTLMKRTGALVTDDLDDDDPATNRVTPRIDARVAIIGPNTDTDGDGCGDDEELGTDAGLGGRRNPLNPWDFYDVNGDGVINLLDDVYAVVAGFGTAAGANYLAQADRSPPPPGVEPWNLGPPDGTINVADDIVAVVTQFGHRCAGPQ